MARSKAERNLYLKGWRERRAQHLKLYMQAYRKTPRYQQRRQRKLAEQAESFNRWKREWKERNPERTRFYVRIRKERLKGAVGECSVEQWLARVAYFGWCCVYCRRGLTPQSLTIDHMIPISRKGTNWASNLVPACRSCNATKRDKTYIEFVDYLVSRGRR